LKTEAKLQKIARISGGFSGLLGGVQRPLASTLQTGNTSRAWKEFHPELLELVGAWHGFANFKLISMYFWHGF